jgi:uncharacterized membrane protein YphA (DoxX/SURF4 family)
MNTLTIVLRIAFGAVFILAAVGKIADPGSFADTIYNYQVLPESLVNITAVFLPWLEVLCGLALIAGFYTRGASFLLTGLTIVFMVALTYNISRGLNVDCGCFSVLDKGSSSMQDALIRDVFLLAAGAFVFWRSMKTIGSAAEKA